MAGFAGRYRGAPGVVEAGLLEGLDVLETHGLLAPAAAPGPEARQRDRYLWLLKRTLSGLLSLESDLRIDFLQGEGRGVEGAALARALHDIRIERPDEFRTLVAARLTGRGPQPRAATTIGLFRLTSLERCAEAVLEAGVAGDFLEAGVGAGGAAIFLRALQVAHGAAERRTWLADSFMGPPPPAASDAPYVGPDPVETPGPAFDLATVQEHFRRYDLLDPQVRFIAGWWADTLPGAETGPLALVRIDVASFSAATTALDALYERVAPGGYLIVDDYGALAACRDAVDRFRERRAIAEPLRWADAACVFWRKAP